MNIVSFRQIDILSDAVRQLSLPTPNHKVTISASQDEEFPRKYCCETTLFCNSGTDEIEENKFTGESLISELGAMDNAAFKCLQYLMDKKGVRINDYNSDALVEKRRTTKKMLEELDSDFEDKRTAYINKKNEIKENFIVARDQLRRVLYLVDH